MIRRKDCRTEVIRYQKNNYTKYTAVKHLLQDGFTQAEIDAAMQDVDFRTGEREYNIMVTQFPTLVYFGIVAIIFLIMGWGEHGTAPSRSISVGVSGLLLFLLIRYFRKVRLAVVIFAGLSVAAFLYCAYEAFVLFSKRELWFREDYDLYFWNISMVLLPLWLFYLNTGLLRKLK